MGEVNLEYKDRAITAYNNKPLFVNPNGSIISFSELVKTQNKGNIVDYRKWYYFIEKFN